MMQALINVEPILWPLLLCSILSLSLVFERLLYFLRLTFARERPEARTLLAQFHQTDPYITKKQHVFSKKYCGLSSSALVLMAKQFSQPRQLRESIMNIWLFEQNSKLESHIKWLRFVGMISPMLGLLGTVLGMIGAFQDMALHTGPVTPSIVADGLQQAMLTTAIGLVIAIPALLAAQIFRIWRQDIITHLTLMLNHLNLSIEDIVQDQESKPVHVSQQIFSELPS